jgi:hypothetical protein
VIAAVAPTTADPEVTGSTQVQEILRESMADLVDANPYADTLNAVENSARALAERFQLEGLEWVRVRKAGRRVFVMVSFFEHPGKSLEGMDSGPAKSPSVTLPRPPAATA